MSVKKRDFSSAALRKGFIEKKRGDHIFFYFTDKDGNLLDYIHTKISHGNKAGDISESLISAMYKQLHFERKEDFIHFIECTFSEEDYRYSLRKWRSDNNI